MNQEVRLTTSYFNLKEYYNNNSETLLGQKQAKTNTYEPALHAGQKNFFDEHFYWSRRFTRIVDAGRGHGDVAGQFAQHSSAKAPCARGKPVSLLLVGHVLGYGSTEVLPV